MNIIVAGEKKAYEEGITVEKLIEEENVETPQYVTVSVNEEFVQKADFSARQLAEGDEVEFLYFMGGGR
ncbi:MAG: sulfur carrier protein ThiS [Lachnospiraceae bacterium]|nr:sulfur carrier protein ThiS [Lachnospiraceae bacterium]